MRQNVTIVIGAQWGDEGKGKWIDILADEADVIARFQGGNNAGHTLYIDGKKVVVHQIPSGIFRSKQKCAITAGALVAPALLLKEIENVKAFADVSPERLWLSARAHVISPWSVYLDTQAEATRSNPIGTTKRGIGPTYALKAARNGLRLGDYCYPERRQAWIDRMADEDPNFKKFLAQAQNEWDEFHSAAEEVRPYVCDAETRVRKAINSNASVLLEGAQGALLDIDHGTYPFVTSSSTAAGGALASLGFSPKRIANIFGVAKAYATRVGEGPFPTELNDANGKHLSEKGHEFGATTGRPRRCGWLDAVALRYAVEVNGLDAIILNKFDILCGMKEIRLATAYQHPDIGRINQFPWEAEVLSACEPVYETYPGWEGSIPQQGRMSDLPKEALRFVEAVEKAVGAEVKMVGTGVNRVDALFK